MKGIKLPGFKIVSGKVVKDQAAAEAKLDLSTRLRRKNSKRVRVKPKG